MNGQPSQDSAPVADNANISTPSTRRSESPYELKYRSLSISSDVEDIEWYKPGGYCPVDVGDIIHDRFKVADKLGYGGVATIWLCLDLQNEKWRAVKINAASRSSEDCADLKAIKLLGNQPHELKELEDNHIMVALETFFVDSPNGRHLCLVLPVAGPSYPVWEERILDFKGEEKLRYKRKICRQLTKGLAFLHEKGICHGDFRPGNILMKLKPGSLDNLGYDGMIDLLGGEAMGEALFAEDEKSPHAPKYACLSVEFLYGRLSELVSDSVVITDFGEAYEISNPPERLDIPHSYAGPEWLLGKQTGIGNDIWSWGYTLAEVMTNGPFPRTFWKIIRRMERFIGPVPAAWGPRALRLILKENDFYGEIKLDYEENEPVTGPTTIPINYQENMEAERNDLQHPIHMVLDAARDMSRNEILLLGDLLGKIFKYNPNERITVTEALGHPWFKYAPDTIIYLPQTLEDEWLRRQPPKERVDSTFRVSENSKNVKELEYVDEPEDLEELEDSKPECPRNTSNLVLTTMTESTSVPESTLTSGNIPSATAANSAQPPKETISWQTLIFPLVVLSLSIFCFHVLYIYYQVIILGGLPSQPVVRHVTSPIRDNV